MLLDSVYTPRLRPLLWRMQRTHFTFVSTGETVICLFPLVQMPIFLMASAKSNSKKDKDIAKTIEFCPLCAPRGINDLRLLFEKGQKKRPVENDLVVPSPKKKSRSEGTRAAIITVTVFSRSNHRRFVC